MGREAGWPVVLESNNFGAFVLLFSCAMSTRLEDREALLDVFRCDDLNEAKTSNMSLKCELKAFGNGRQSVDVLKFLQLRFSLCVSRLQRL